VKEKLEKSPAFILWMDSGSEDTSIATKSDDAYSQAPALVKLPQQKRCANQSALICVKQTLVCAGFSAFLPAAYAGVVYIY
jgi:hypothetical protein